MPFYLANHFSTLLTITVRSHYYASLRLSPLIELRAWLGGDGGGARCWTEKFASLHLSMQPFGMAQKRCLKAALLDWEFASLRPAASDFGSATDFGPDPKAVAERRAAGRGLCASRKALAADFGPSGLTEGRAVADSAEGRTLDGESASLLLSPLLLGLAWRR